MNQNKISYIFSLLLTIIFPLEVFASCENTPLPGVKLIVEEDKYKIISTYENKQMSTDADLINYSLKVAEFKAQSKIYKFLGINQNETTLPLFKLGECVTLGKFVRVSYGTRIDKDKYKVFN